MSQMKILDFKSYDGSHTVRSFMTSDFAASFLPQIFVPLIGIMGPAVFIVLIGRYITASAE